MAEGFDMYDANVPAPMLIGVLTLGAAAAVRSIRERAASRVLHPVRVAADRRRRGRRAR